MFAHKKWIPDGYLDKGHLSVLLFIGISTLYYDDDDGGGSSKKGWQKES